MGQLDLKGKNAACGVSLQCLEQSFCAVQFYGSNEEASPVFFGDASSKKFGTYFVKDGKVSMHCFSLLSFPCSRSRPARHFLCTQMSCVPASLLSCMLWKAPVSRAHH